MTEARVLADLAKAARGMQDSLKAISTEIRYDGGLTDQLERIADALEKLAGGVWLESDDGWKWIPAHTIAWLCRTEAGGLGIYTEDTWYLTVSAKEAGRVLAALGIPEPPTSEDGGAA